MISGLTSGARELIASGRLAHLATVNDDGGPQLSVVWVGLDGDELVTAHLGARRRLQHSLTIHGRARVTEGGAAELLQQLAYTYVGPGVRFPPFDDPPPGYLLHISVDRIGGLGPWNPSPMSD